MNRLFFDHMFVAGLVPLLAIHGLLLLAARVKRGRLALWGLAAVVALPPLGFYGATLVMLPWWASAPWPLLAGAVLWAARRRGRDWVHAALWTAAYTVVHTSTATWAFWLVAPGCGAIEHAPGVVRLDGAPPWGDESGVVRQFGGYALDVDPEERFAYVSYAHGSVLRGVARFPLRASGEPRMITTSGSGILHVRYHAASGRLFAIDHNERRLLVFRGDPFELLGEIEVDSREPMDVAFDDESRRLFVIDRTETPDAADPADRSAGVLVHDLDHPEVRVGRVPLEVLPGANEFILSPGERRVFVTSEGFITLHALDLARLTSTRIYTGVPGVGGGAVDPARRELYITHTVGLVQVRGTDDFAYRRTLFVHGARAVALDAARGALYVNDFFNGQVARIDPQDGTILGTVPVGHRMRQMRVLRDGRLLTASACGVLVVDPP